MQAMSGYTVTFTQMTYMYTQGSSQKGVPRSPGAHIKRKQMPPRMIMLQKPWQNL